MSIFPSPFDPLEIGALEIPGRIFKTATSETSADPDGFVTDRLLLFYEQMAQGGTPMMITGNLYAGPLGKSTRNMTGIDADEKIPGLRRLTDRVSSFIQPFDGFVLRPSATSTKAGSRRSGNSEK